MKTKPLCAIITSKQIVALFLAYGQETDSNKSRDIEAKLKKLRSLSEEFRCSEITKLQK